MIMLQRISRGPTVPEMMQAEFDGWAIPVRQTLIAAIWHGPAEQGRMLARFWVASAILAAARALLLLGLIEPDCAAGAFPIAVRLCRGSVSAWQRTRRPRSPSHP